MSTGLNQAQHILEETIVWQLRTTGMVRIVILKGRQQGLSTHVGGRLYHAVSQRKAAKALVIAHKSDSTDSLFQMTKRYHQNVPEILRPSTKYSSRKELQFDVLDSSYMVATAGGDGVARGETITCLHASELAFWKSSTAREIWNGLRQSVPETPGTMIFVESTANGIGNVFHELWTGAVNGTNGYAPVFIPWFVQDEYRSTAPDDFEPTPEELKLIEAHGLDYDQLFWRRKKVGENGLELFQQEYPCTPEEAFLASGRPVFVPEQIHDRLQEVKGVPMKRLALEGDKWEHHTRGELKQYFEPEQGESYVIGADVASGVRDGDWSVAQVLDGKKRQVATYRARIDPEWFANVLDKLAKYYNFAYVAIENDKHGVLTNHILSKEHLYPNVFMDELHDQVNDRFTKKLGWTPTAKTKPMVINELRAALRVKEVELNDSETLKEMLTFIETESGKMEAEEGCHDDCVMSLCIANHIHTGEIKPIENQDDWYFEAI